MDIVALVAWDREKQQRHEGLMRRVAMAHTLIQAARYDASTLNVSATMEPLVQGTKNILLIAIGAFQHGVAQAPQVTGRHKDQKFGILDAPGQLLNDLAEVSGLFGAAVIYLDIDKFKDVNTKYTERVVDRTVLPQFQQRIAEAVSGHGYAYAEGGDEVIILLPNFSASLARVFALDLVEAVRSTEFSVDGASVRLTISAGVAAGSTAEKIAALPERANEAKKFSKEQGRDRAGFWTAAGCEPA
jgi:diguanylate cyclase (GGDEF)-like protein